MKKLLLGLFLIAVLAAVVYLQLSRDTDKRSAAYRKGYRTGVDSLKTHQPDFDSVAELLGRERQALAEYKETVARTLSIRDSLHQQEVDSLTDKIEQQKTDIGKLKQKSLAKKAPTSNDKTASTGQNNLPSHREILDHYKEAMAKLPADLSPYEYQVAVTEVRTETAARFSITLDRLNEIRKANNVDF